MWWLALWLLGSGVTGAQPLPPPVDTAIVHLLIGTPETGHPDDAELALPPGFRVNAMSAVLKIEAPSWPVVFIPVPIATGKKSISIVAGAERTFTVEVANHLGLLIYQSEPQTHHPQPGQTLDLDQNAISAQITHLGYYVIPVDTAVMPVASEPAPIPGSTDIPVTTAIASPAARTTRATGELDTTPTLPQLSSSPTAPKRLTMGPTDTHTAIPQHSIETEASKTTNTPVNATETWDNEQLSLRITAQQRHDIRLIFRYQDAHQFYEFIWKTREHRAQVDHISPDGRRPLAERPLPYQGRHVYELNLRVQQDTMQLVIDRQVIFERSGLTIAHGHIALHCQGILSSCFAEVRISDLQATP